MNNSKIFSNLELSDVFQLETILVWLFGKTDTITGRKSTLSNAGIDNYFISNLDFNLNIREFTTILVAKLIDFSISSQRQDYHPLMALISYFLQRSQQYNLDDETINLFNRIYLIGQNNLNNISFKSNNGDQKSNSESNNKLNSYLKRISQNLIEEGCLSPETNVSYENQQFDLVGKITNFELSFGVLNMRGDAFFIFSHFDSINIKILRRYAGLCLQYATEKSTSSSAGQIINARVPSNTCFAIAVVDNLNEDTKNTIQTENPFDIDTDTLWYKVPVVYSLNEQRLYYYDRPTSFWENFKGEIVWKKLREIIENILNP